MKFSLALITVGLFGGALAQQGVQCPGSWYLQPDDCMCMNSREGYLLKTQTLDCCKKLGYKTYNNICAVDRNKRQTFKDCCKDLNQESVIGHCR
ncbi:uncharacterized protein PODANS_5_4050 [Podospora anserina S mat+]|uniref:Podospora anserina S mat+ genomic DNA chromosome 5, supercontig 4 n=5 Tax=Podospora TaxID=5144 RepID=B2ALM1_PODAN|nr:uncharacterized protein PODANS_5_4050 [Podospora anserina S mat+]KAK4641801.1 hypothetical protein QC761_504050 [Podospora bellae-mahoneyi]KAK4652978.1 hypothetical protein QC762_504050 [Podospora pseudocomata]KAK4664270.1 hypothetical protein QC763_504050 [Podospora pseudopauciseta]KAK4675410.1 hypothetical protein QC764_504050 [Podospora pseudoanserina]CAP64859.1 unnamed protein product [Podospora anserina S mat+]